MKQQQNVYSNQIPDTPKWTMTFEWIQRWEHQEILHQHHDHFSQNSGWRPINCYKSYADKRRHVTYYIMIQEDNISRGKFWAWVIKSEQTKGKMSSSSESVCNILAEKFHVSQWNWGVSFKVNFIHLYNQVKNAPP